MNSIRLNRRSILKATLGSGMLLAAPSIIRAQGSSSGELTLHGWEGYQVDKVLERFTKETGIKVNFIGHVNQDSMFAQARLSAQGSGGADLAEPTVERISQWLSDGMVQPLDRSKLEMDHYVSGMPGTKEGDPAYISGKMYFVPSCWGGEAMGYASDVPNHAYGEASLKQLFDPQFEGQVTVRAESALPAMGRLMDLEGKLPRPYLDSYKSEEAMRQNFDVILPEVIKAKSNFVQFWSNDNEASGAFLSNGARVGLVWESAGRMIKPHGFDFVAPKEGAFAWVQGFVLLKNAPNVEQANAYLNWISKPENSAILSKGYLANPSCVGAVELMDEVTRAFVPSSYPGDAMEKMWWRPAADTWFVKLLGGYCDKLRAA